MNKLLVTGIVVGSLLACTSGFSQDAKPEAPPAAPVTKAVVKAPALEEMTLTGKITKEDVTKKTKDGKEVTFAKYTLTDAQGVKAMLPHAGKRGKEGAIDLSAFVDQNVKVTGMGHNGKLMKITAVDKVAEAPAAAK